MVWLNTDCINETPPKGYFGGSMCTCNKCVQDRIEKEKDIYIYCSECGKKSSKLSKFCYKCGNSLLT